MVSRSCQASTVMAIYPHLIATWALPRSALVGTLHHLHLAKFRPAYRSVACLPMASSQRLRMPMVISPVDGGTTRAWRRRAGPGLGSAHLLCQASGSLRGGRQSGQFSVTTNRLKLKRKSRVLGEGEEPWKGEPQTRRHLDFSL